MLQYLWWCVGACGITSLNGCTVQLLVLRWVNNRDKEHKLLQVAFWVLPFISLAEYIKMMHHNYLWFGYSLLWIIKYYFHFSTSAFMSAYNVIFIISPESLNCVATIVVRVKDFWCLVAVYMQIHLLEFASILFRAAEQLRICCRKKCMAIISIIFEEQFKRLTIRSTGENKSDISCGTCKYTINGQ